jgi:hypothetical protein
MIKVFIPINLLAGDGLGRFVEGKDLDPRKTSKIPVKSEKLRGSLFTANSDNLSVKDQITPRIYSANRLVKQDWIARAGIQHPYGWA